MDPAAPSSNGPVGRQFPSSPTRPVRSRQHGLQDDLQKLVVALPFGLLLLICAIIASLTIGARSIPLDVVWHSLSGQDAGVDGTLVLHARLPRTLAGLAAGIALGVSGALIQTICRNPLSDPGILGLNAGASLAVTLAIITIGPMVPVGQFAIAITGALVAVILLFGIAGSGAGDSNSGQFILAGIALAAVMGGLTSALCLLNPSLFDRMRYWEAGTLDIGNLGLASAVLPVIGMGVVMAMLLARPLNALALGNDMAASLGVRPLLVQGVGLSLVSLLCGTATALTGPISFVGLMVPHVVRRIVGPDMRRVLPVCMIFGPILLLTADILGRVLIAGELRVSIVTAFLGAPLLIWVARQPRRAG